VPNACGYTGGELTLAIGVLGVRKMTLARVDDDDRHFWRKHHVPVVERAAVEQERGSAPTEQ